MRWQKDRNEDVTIFFLQWDRSVAFQENQQWEEQDFFFYYYKYFPSYPVKSRKIIENKINNQKNIRKNILFFLWLFCLKVTKPCELLTYKKYGNQHLGTGLPSPNPIRPTWDNVVESLFDTPLSTWRWTMSSVGAHGVVRVFTSCLQQLLNVLTASTRISYL